MGEHNSPFYAAGCADGERDSALMSTCPGQPPVGPDPGKDWSAMYLRGYDRTFVPGYHEPCRNCRQQQDE